MALMLPTFTKKDIRPMDFDQTLQKNASDRGLLGSRPEERPLPPPNASHEQLMRKAEALVTKVAKSTTGKPLTVERVIEVDERVRADGTVEHALDLDGALRALEAAKADGIAAVAIVFMHAYRYPEHERQVAALARRMGFAQVSVSHEVSPLIKLVGRGDTTVVDAYLSPILARYVGQLAEELDVARTQRDRLLTELMSGAAFAREGEKAYQRAAELETIVKKLERNLEQAERADGHKPLVEDEVTANQVAQVVSPWTGVPFDARVERGAEGGLVPSVVVGVGDD